MSASFANLMALSASQTQQQQSAVAQALRERQRKEALRIKQQAEQEAKELAKEKERRLKLFEAQKKEEEARKREEEARTRREQAAKKREDEAKYKLLFGAKKAAKMVGSSSASAGAAGAGKGKGRSPGASGAGGSKAGSKFLDDDDDDGGPIPLTREELRQRKLDREMARIYGTKKSSTGTSSSSSYLGGTTKAGRKLPGGAVDITMNHNKSSSSQADGKSVKDRLTSMPNALVKLNVNKRDTRTIDEIMRDKEKAKAGKVLEGDEAAAFDDWFGSSKKKEKEAVKQTPMAAGSRLGSAAPSSGADTPTTSRTSISV